MIRNVFRSFHYVGRVGWLIIIHILMFAMAGYVLFRDVESEENDENWGGDRLRYFDTIQRSILTLFTLLTTANFPDCMLLVVQRNMFYGLFFVIYVLVGLFFFMNLVLGVLLKRFQVSRRAGEARANMQRHQAAA